MSETLDIKVVEAEARPCGKGEVGHMTEILYSLVEIYYGLD